MCSNKTAYLVIEHLSFGYFNLMLHLLVLIETVQQCLIDQDIPLHLSTTVTNIHGRDRLEGVTIAQVDEKLSEVRQRARECEGDYMLHLNEYKMELSDCVREQFGMEYHYDIDMLRIGLTEMEQEDFLAQAESLCGDLKSTLDRILLYREENAYKVCHRINAINRLARELRRIADTL